MKVKWGSLDQENHWHQKLVKNTLCIGDVKKHLVCLAGFICEVLPSENLKYPLYPSVVQQQSTVIPGLLLGFFKPV